MGKEKNKNMNTMTVNQPTLTITLDEGAIVNEVKRAIKMIKGVASISTVKQKKETITYSLEDLNRRIEKADEDYLAGRCISMQQDESAEDFINRMLCATT